MPLRAALLEPSTKPFQPAALGQSNCVLISPDLGLSPLGGYIPWPTSPLRGSTWATFRAIVCIHLSLLFLWVISGHVAPLEDPYHLNLDALHRLPRLRQPLTLTFASSVTKQDIQDHFGTHGTGSIKEIKLMNGFGFIEYEDPMDARDVVPGMLTQISRWSGTG